MNILVIGSGGREHTLCWKLRQSQQCDEIYALPGNGGTQTLATNVGLPESGFEAIGQFVKNHPVGLVIVGPEAPLVSGIRDYFAADPQLKGIPFIGPGSAGALLEGSKDFSKKFMERHGIPTAVAQTFSLDEIGEAKKYLHSRQAPFVLKADGLAAGKGVVICESVEEAHQILDHMLKDRVFGRAGDKVLIEDFLEGIELSVFILTDGTDYVLLPEAKDYKRIGDGDTGPNTGGMGAVSPVPFATREFKQKVEERIIRPTVNGMAKDGIEFCGFLFIGLMNVRGEPYVIEYNVRMGDPESQSVFPRLKTDLVDLLRHAASKNLKNYTVETDPSVALTVVLASEGYPGNYEKGKVINMDPDRKDILLFHAGTRMDPQNRLLTSGGRVMAVTGMGTTIQEARTKVYEGIQKIHWDGKIYRKDIGIDLINP